MSPDAIIAVEILDDVPIGRMCEQDEWFCLGRELESAFLVGDTFQIMVSIRITHPLQGRSQGNRHTLQRLALCIKDSALNHRRGFELDIDIPNLVCDKVRRTDCRAIARRFDEKPIISVGAL